MPYSLLRSECGKYYLPQRWTIVILITVAMISSYGQRVNFSMVVSEMAVKPNKSDVACPKDTDTDTSSASSSDDNTQKWDQKDQGILLAAFYIGYVVMHFPTGWVSDQFGSRLIMTLSILLSSVVTLLFPLAVDSGFVAVCVARLVIGFAQAGIYPNSTSLLGRWIPKNERATAGGIVFAASSWGTIIGNLMSGVFSETLGWRSVFYIWGAFGVVWYFFALIWMYSDPDTDPLITEREKTYLDENIRKREKNVRLDVKAMLADGAVWAMVAGQFGHAYLIFFLTTNMPKYFSDVLGVPMKQNMWANSLPYFLQWVSSVASGKLGDYTIEKKGWNIAFVRKLYTTIAVIFPSICLLIVPYVGCDPITVIVLMCLALFLMGPFYCGLKVNVIDLTHNFAGFVMAIVNGLGSISGVMNPYIVGWIAFDNTFEQWYVVMWVIFIVSNVCNAFYIFFGKAERRIWDVPEEEKEEFKENRARAKEEKQERKMAKKQAIKEAKEAKKQGSEET